MRTIETRLQKIEAATDAVTTRACTCADRVRVLWPGDESADAGPERCAKCGGLRVTVRVNYTSDNE